MSVTREVRSEIIKYTISAVFVVIAAGFGLRHFLENNPTVSAFLGLLLILCLLFYEYLLLFVKKIYNRLIKLSLNVGFVIDTSNSEGYHEEVVHGINSSLSDVCDLIKFTDLSSVEKISNEKEAKSLILKYNNLHLIIWGSFSKKLTLKGKVVTLLRVHFVWQHRDDMSGSVTKHLLPYFKLLFTPKGVTWNIYEEDSVTSIRRISGEVSFYYKYMLAVLLTTEYEYEKSLELLQKIDTSILDKKVVEKVNSLIANNLSYLLSICFNDLHKIKRNKEKDVELIKKGMLYCNQMLALNENDIRALPALAYFEYTLNPEKGRYIELINKTYKLNPDDGGTLVDLAFLYVVQKKFSKAYSKYKKITSLNFTLTDTLAHLDEEYFRLKEPGFIFGAAYLSYYFGDIKLAKQYFKTFLEEASYANYGEMYTCALKLYEKL